MAPVVTATAPEESTTRSVRHIVALSFAIAATVLGIGYAALALTNVDSSTGTSIATQLGDPSLAPAVNDAIEASGRTVGVVGFIVCAAVLVMAVLVLRRLGPVPKARRSLALSAVASFPACFAIFVVVSLIVNVYWNATKTTF